MSFGCGESKQLRCRESLQQIVNVVDVPYLERKRENKYYWLIREFEIANANRQETTR